MPEQIYVTRSELKEEFLQFEDRFMLKMTNLMDVKFDQFATRFETLLFDALKLERDYVGKRFDAIDVHFEKLETILEKSIAKNAVEHGKYDAALAMHERKLRILLNQPLED